MKMKTTYSTMETTSNENLQVPIRCSVPNPDTTTKRRSRVSRRELARLREGLRLEIEHLRLDQDANVDGLIGLLNNGDGDGDK